MDTYRSGNDNDVRSWASTLDPKALEQAKRSARLDVVSGPIALMPDAHYGMGATVGSVIPTKSAVIPAAVGVDIGCGMIAVRTRLDAADLPDTLEPWLSEIGRRIPAGLGKWHGDVSNEAFNWINAHPIEGEVEDGMKQRAAFQLGTLGGGNHFVEVGLDEDNVVWLVLHSGSRGIGHKLAQRHIRGAKDLAKNLERRLEDRDLAYFLDTDKGFQAYIRDMLWAQDYAWQNREMMMNALLSIIEESYPTLGRLEADRINCHHNYTCQESHGDDKMWITRKGAINAEVGKLGIIPGSMGTSTFIVEGLGDPRSYNSAPHGSGRVLSRRAAKETFTQDDLHGQMADVDTWQSDSAASLVDEAPGAYKDIEKVMKDSETLVNPLREIVTVLNYKGVNG